MRTSSRGSALGTIVLIAVASLSAPGVAAPGAESNADPAADAALSAAEQASAAVRHMLQTARAQRDIVKTLCLNDKLNQIDVTVRSARERREAYATAVAHGGGELGSHELTMLGVLRQRAQVLAAEANQCIGSPDPSGADRDATSGYDPFPYPELTRYPEDIDAVFVPPPVPTAASGIK
jgi:uncharacterized protein (DUF2342 family)